MDNETKEQEKSQVESIRDVLNALVPPDNVEVTDVFGDKHKVSSSISARRQVKIMRLLEEIKDINVNNIVVGDMTPQSMFNILIKLMANEQIFCTLCRCVEIAYPSVLSKMLESAEASSYDYDKDLPVADLMPIEEVVALLVPLSLKIARRTGQAIQALTKVA